MYLIYFTVLIIANMTLNPCSNIAVLEREHIHMYEFIWEISAIIGDADSVTTWIQSAE